MIRQYVSQVSSCWLFYLTSLESSSSLVRLSNWFLSRAKERRQSLAGFNRLQELQESVIITLDY